MRNILYIVTLIFILISCSDDDEDYLEGKIDDEKIGALSNISNLKAEPRVGAVLLSWDIPSDSSFSYVEVKYLKNDKEVKEQVSKHTDSILIEDLINKEPTSFEVQTIKKTHDKEEVGEVANTDEVTPIKREPEIERYPDQLNHMELTTVIVRFSSLQCEESDEESA